MVIIISNCKMQANDKKKSNISEPRLMISWMKKCLSKGKIIPWMHWRAIITSLITVRWFLTFEALILELYSNEAYIKKQYWSWMKNIPQSMSCTFYIRLHIDESERKACWRSYTFSSLWKCFIHKHSFTTLCRSCSSTPSTLPSPIPSFSSVLPRFVSLHRWYTFKFPKG